MGERTALGVLFRVLEMSTSPFAVIVDIDGAGSHPAAWRHADAEPGELLSAAWVAANVSAAERAGVTAVTFSDHPLPPRDVDGPTARLDAVLQASFTAPLTSALGLIPVVHGLYTEPFHLATQTATVDTASLGRAGVLIEGDEDPRIAARHGREPLPAPLVAEELTDVVEAIRRLWDTWEGDAVIRDVSTGRFFDPAKVHYADFEGHRFSVKGPAILPRSPQGQLPVFSAHSGIGADVVLVDAPLDASLGAVREARAAHPADTRVILELEIALDRAGQTGAERVAALDEHAVWAGSGRARYVGDAEGLARILVSLTDVVDGVRIRPAVLGHDLDELARAVLPRLRDVGVFRSPLVGSTLRESLGLGAAVNRFAEVSR